MIYLPIHNKNFRNCHHVNDLPGGPGPRPRPPCRGPPSSPRRTWPGGNSSSYAGVKNIEHSGSSSHLYIGDILELIIYKKVDLNYSFEESTTESCGQSFPLWQRFDRGVGNWTA